jgi:hypothetical protein
VIEIQPRKGALVPSGPPLRPPRRQKARRLLHATYREISTFLDDLANTVERVRVVPGDMPLRLKLARLYARYGDHARAPNQYQVYLSRKPADRAVRGEVTALTERLRTAGQLPPMETFHRMLASAAAGAGGAP